MFLTSRGADHLLFASAQPQRLDHAHATSHLHIEMSAIVYINCIQTHGVFSLNPHTRASHLEIVLCTLNSFGIEAVEWS